MRYKLYIMSRDQTRQKYLGHFAGLRTVREGMRRWRDAGKQAVGCKFAIWSPMTSQTYYV